MPAGAGGGDDALRDAVLSVATAVVGERCRTRGGGGKGISVSISIFVIEMEVLVGWVGAVECGLGTLFMDDARVWGGWMDVRINNAG